MFAWVGCSIRGKMCKRYNAQEVYCTNGTMNERYDAQEVKCARGKIDEIQEEAQGAAGAKC